MTRPPKRPEAPACQLGSSSLNDATRVRDELVAALVDRCTFPDAGTSLECAFSGGADSTALLILGVAARCAVVAHHVDHGLRPSSGHEAANARTIADAVGVPFVEYRIHVDPGPNLEARARAARTSALPDNVATGHTLDDQAETVLANLLRGAGTGGLAAMRPSACKPLLSLRRHETEELCQAFGLRPVHDPSNHDASFRRNRIRHELLPLCDRISDRDVAPLLARAADLCRQDDDMLDDLSVAIDPTDAVALRDASPVLAVRALRSWLTVAGYPPDRAALERVLDVVHGRRTACELAGGVRVARTGQRLRRIPPGAQ